MALATMVSARRLWIRWPLLSAIGLAAGLVAGLVLGAPIQGVVGMMLVTPVLTSLVGTILGTAQWLELRRYFASAGWWIAASTAGLGIGLAAAVVLVEQVGRVMKGGPVNVATLGVWERAASMAVLGLISGASLGFAQWLVFRRLGPRTGHWLWVNTLAFGVALVVASLAADLLFAGLPALVRLGGFIVLAGLLAGALTAAQLVRVLEVARLHLSPSPFNVEGN